MTKDRLEELKKIMQEGNKDEATDDWTGENSASLVSFFEQIKSVKVKTEVLKSRVDGLKVLLHDNRQWTNVQLRKELERKVEEEKLIIGTSAKSIRNDLKSVKSTPPDGKGISAIQRIKDVQLNAILKELNQVLRNYLNCLTEHREKSVKILKNMLEVKGDETADIDALLEEGKIAIFTNNLLIGDMEEKYNLREAQDRREGIMKIESSILEIRNLFNELALIVDLQGERVEEVGKLVDKNLTKVERGNKKLTSANKKRKKMRYRKLIIGSVCCCVIIIVPVLLIMI